MKYLKPLLIATFFLVAFFVISCERDDICPESTQTTPKLVIQAYDAAVQENRKNIFGLRIQGIDNDNVLEGYNIITEDDLVLPLRTDATTTQYSLRKDTSINNNGTPEDASDDFFNGNEDIITITYTTEQVYVSRACGYKTIFNNVSLTIEPDSDNWILSRQTTSDNQTLENEQAALFNIYH
tara:strand:- start:20746 stop:21291 length:546 start_codon:yes stop_codon:yes gene_type:complete